jgi:ribosomal-protein-serine acetyltransferase
MSNEGVKPGLTTITVNEEISLKHVEFGDAEDIFHTIDTQREYLAKWLPFVPMTLQISDTENFIRSLYSGPDESRELVFVIHFQKQFAGLIGFKNTDRLNRKTEIGYWISEPFQKKGIITRSVEALIKYCFHELGMNRIEIRCAVENFPSKNIPKRLGFQFEGIEREGELLSDGSFTDLERYSLLRKDIKLEIWTNNNT